MSMGAREHYLEQFAIGRAQLPGAALPWTRRAREAALERFAERGFPTTRDEAWKYTSVAAIERRPFRLVAEAAEGRAAELVARHALEGCHVLVFVNGRHLAGLSRLGRLPDGAHVGSLAELLAGQPERVEEWFDDDAGADDGFAALNAALWSDGAWIDLAAGVALDRPIHLLHLATASAPGTEPAIFPRNLIRLGERAQATIIEHYVGDGDAPYLTNAVTRIQAGAGAMLTHAKLQQEGSRGFHIAQIRADQERDSQLHSASFAFGALLSRTGIATRFGAEGCAADLIGLYLGSGRRHVDHHTLIDHARPHGTSREFYKGVLDGASRAVFSGRVVVRPDAQHSDAQQANHNLLLSDAAEVDTKPQLEIWADDVKCSHGATVGQLDAEQRYYLRTRGMDDATACAVLIHAFAAEVLARVDTAPLRTRLEALLRARLPGAIEESSCERQDTN
jgi:Fe-S cluster assembly protein SufD